MNWALLIIYFLTYTSMLWAAHKHKQPKNENYDFWATLINSIIWLTLVWWATGWRFI